MRLLLTLLLAGAAATPLTWKKTTRDAELSLTIPAMARHAPVLADRLYRGEIKQLQGFAAEAAKGRADEPAAFRAQGRWEMQVNYDPAVETPRLISLYRQAYTDSHGAHPNTAQGGVVFDKTTKANLHPLDLLKPGADLVALNQALCTAARAEKRRRAEGDWDEKQDSNFHCPTWKGIPYEKGKIYEGSNPPQIALATGDVAGRAAGLTFIYSPYDLGAYVEGPYDVTLPLTVLKGALKPEYAAEFAGRPRPDTRLEK